MKLRTYFILALSALTCKQGYAQSPLFIPPVLTGTTFNLNVQSGTTTFFTGYNTQTYGANGVLLAPTLIWNQGDSVTVNVTNNLPSVTTMHWHGLHVPAMWDGGPHQSIAPTTTWSPRFKIMNHAGTYWYHPHGDMKTELQVAKGVAGMIIIKDPAEAAITLPRTYSVDDFPLIVQSKAFDALRQIAIASEDDTTVMVNGTIKPYLNVPAQVVRLRLLNASSMRNFLLGLSADMPFKLIANDAGLLDSATTLTRIRLSPGERVEILVDLSGMSGSTIFVKNYGSELPNGIHGALNVGMGSAVIPGYNLNPKNGGDYDVLQLNVGAPTSSPVITMPTMLVTQSVWPVSSVNRTRTIELSAEPPVDSLKMVEGPFVMNGNMFDMSMVNDTVYLGHTEIWTLINNTLIAHPFHIHDVFFYVLDINGAAPPLAERGKKDVVLVQPGDTVRFITKFEDFADAHVPYMYHCHLLHHEDDGMMGSFVVIDSNTLHAHDHGTYSVVVSPNPAKQYWTVKLMPVADELSAVVYDIAGSVVWSKQLSGRHGIPSFDINNDAWPSGVYILSIRNAHGTQTVRLVKQG
jgi:blue copper oxidase